MRDSHLYTDVSDVIICEISPNCGLFESSSQYKYVEATRELFPVSSLQTTFRAPSFRKLLMTELFSDYLTHSKN